jgi:16S rRNA (cytidine1402-2'-O)-methyltransferase
MAGILYIVPTPIGNLEDITLRALRILREVDLIAAEDTRTTGRLLAHYGIETPQTSYHEHNKLAKLDRVLRALETGDVALVSDAGTPGLSDPGYELIQAAIAAGLTVVPLPGASALLPAVVASGLPTDRFTFVGFLPRKSSARRAMLENLRDWDGTLVFYEAPHRLLDVLADLRDLLGPREVCAARELTKLYEEIWRGTLDEAVDYFTRQPPRGEFTLVVSGADPGPAAVWTEEDVRARLADLLAQGESRSSAARALAGESGWPRRKIYDLDV